MTELEEAVAASTLPEDVMFLTRLTKSTAKELVDLRRRVKELEEEVTVRKEMAAVLNTIIEAMQDIKDRGHV
jgi:hypothetical protein